MKNIVIRGALKIDSNGNFIWIKRYYNNGGGNMAVQSPDGGYAVLGSANTSFYVLKTDSSGDVGCNQINSNIALTNGNLVPGNPATALGFGGFTGPAPIVIIPYKPVIRDPCDTANAIENNLANSAIAIKLYPIPCHDELYLSFEDKIAATRLTLTLINVLGSEVFTTAIRPSGPVKLNLSDVIPGVYFLKITGGNTLYTTKIIIQ